MRFLEKIILFFLGGGSYVGLELVWRGRSHSSMFCLGGLCFLLIGKLTRLHRIPLALRLIVSAGMITALELLTGLLVNRNYTVWDYREMPYHYLGQICLNYSLLWIPVSLFAMHLYATAESLLLRKRVQ